jgi:hypothetical protein
MQFLSGQLRWFFSALRERSFVVAIIGLVTTLYALGLAVPQRRTVPAATWAEWRVESPRLVRALEATGLADVYRAPVTYVALGFFFLSLGAVVVERFPRLLRRTRLDQGIPLDVAALASRRGTVELRSADPGAAVLRAAAVLEGSGYRLHSPAPGSVRAVRFRIAPLGFVLFHGAFALILAGAVLLDVTRFSGVANVAEGEPFDIATSELAERPRTPRIGRAHPELSFTVSSVRPRSEGGFPLALDVAVLLPGERLPRVAGVNEPVVLGTTSLLVQSAGAAPLFTCEADGVRDGAWVKLVPDLSGRTRFLLEPCGLDVLARTHQPGPAADAGGEGKGVMLASTGVARLEDVATNGVEVAVRGPDGAIARGLLRPGDSLATPDGRRVLRMPELRYYAKLQIVDERGGGFLWAGFILGTVGLVLRLVLYRRELALVADPAGGRLLVAAAADVAGWRPDALLERLAAEVGAHAPGVGTPPSA